MNRYTNLANWRKPGLWVVLAVVVGCAALAVCLLTNPVSRSEQEETEAGGHRPVETLEVGGDAGGGADFGDNGDAGAGTGFGGDEDVMAATSGADRDNGLGTVVQLTIDDVIALSEKGEALSWTDFEQYPYEDIGSGLYIRHYEIDDTFSLLIGGSSLESKPMYIWLRALSGLDGRTDSSGKPMPSESVDQQISDKTEEIDIRYEDVRAFVEKARYETGAVVMARSDLDHDGETENVVVRTVIPDQIYEIAVEKEDGTQIWTEEASPAHVGWNTIMLYSEDGQDYLIQYLPTMFQGIGSYTCTVFSLEGGKETVKEEWSVDFVLPAEESLALTPEMTRFSEEVGSLLRESIVLLSTEQGILVEGPIEASALPQLYPVHFDPNEIQEAMDKDAANVREASSDAASYPDAPLEMLFASGAGAWGTTLILQPDGTFTGDYYSHYMNENTLEYPYGTIYVCRFSGRFSEPTQISDYAFSLYLEELTTEEPTGKEWIEDNVRYITSVPLGMEDGEEFILYAPGIPADVLPEEFRDWWPGAWRWRSGELSQLNCWGLCNVNTGEGFFE